MRSSTQETEQAPTETETNSHSSQPDAHSPLARQLAHDLCSPLAALSAVASQTTSLPEDERELIQAAVTELREIVKTLQTH